MHICFSLSTTLFSFFGTVPKWSRLGSQIVSISHRLEKKNPPYCFHRSVACLSRGGVKSVSAHGVRTV